jgi:hypothetical protein
MKCCTLYQKDGYIYIICYSRSKIGFWFESEPVFKTMKHMKHEIKYSILKCLENSKNDTEFNAKESKILNVKIIEISKVKSWPNFIKNCKCIDIKCEDEKISISTWQNVKKKDADFLPDKENIIKFDINSDANIFSEAINKAFELCK